VYDEANSRFFKKEIKMSGPTLYVAIESRNETNPVQMAISKIGSVAGAHQVDDLVTDEMR
jgi:hypothetical protein